MAKKGGLGKGLDYLMTEAGAETAGARSDIELPIEKITTNPKQPRKSFDQDELEKLADSIKQNGILQPLLVRKQGTSYEIVAGERRYQAARLAGIPRVPVLIRSISDEDVLKIALIENLQRQDLDPMEEARAYKTLLMEKKITQEELASLLSKSRPSISNTLRLLDLPEEIQELVEQGRLSSGHARAILAVKNSKGQLRLAEKAVKEQLSVRKTEQLAPLYNRTYATETLPAKKSNPLYRQAAKALRAALTCPVKVRQNKDGGKIEIAFVDETQLAELVDKICAGKQAGARQQSGKAGS